MCWSEKCCFFIPAHLGCLLLGICSFTLSTFMMVASVVGFIIETEEGKQLAVQRLYVLEVLGLSLNVSTLKIVLTIAIVISALWMLFSALLIIGITKKKASLVLCYFSSGIVVTIICQLIALLVLLHNCWILAIVLFICFLVHIHFLVVVHTVYELMQKGKDFSFQQHQDNDEDLLADCFDDSIDTTDVEGALAIDTVTN